MYLQEMAAKEETTIERQAKMREQAKQLKEKREAERLAYVQEKLDQQWRCVPKDPHLLNMVIWAECNLLRLLNFPFTV